MSRGVRGSRLDRGGTAPFLTVCSLARGGMARVELVVRAGSAGDVYALKRPLAERGDDPEFRRMFFDEARIAQAVRHPNIVAVRHVGEDDAGPFLLMEYVEGVSAAALLRHHDARDTYLPAAIALEVVRQAALGLHAAHEATADDGSRLAIVHRDVSPQNILVGFDGVVRVADFGVARALGRQAKTSTGVLKGKLGYMSPEQLRFESLDRRSDLFSLGVVLFELLAGERLYAGGDTDSVARRVRDEAPPDIGEVRPHLPPALVEVVFSMLAKRAADRPNTALEVADRLHRVMVDLAEVDLGDYCRRTFAQEQEDARTRVSEGLARLQTDAPATSPDRQGRSRSGWRSVAPLVAAAAAAAGAAAIVFALAERPGEDTGPGRVAVSELRAQWTTPNTVHWVWEPRGQPEDLLRYELVVAASSEALRANEDVAVWGPSRNPELARFLRPRTGGRDRVASTLTLEHPPDTAIYAQLRAIDTSGAVSTSNLAGARTAIAPSEAVVLYDDGDPRTTPSCLHRSSTHPFDGDGHLEYLAACDGDGKSTCGPVGEGACWANLAILDVGLDPSQMRLGVFDNAYLEFAVALDGPVPSYWSEVQLVMGGTEWRIGALTVPAGGKYRLYQVKLAALTHDERALSHADLAPIDAMLVGGLWEAGSTVRLDAVRIRW